MAHALSAREKSAALSAAVTDATWQSILALPDDEPVPPGHAFELYCPIWTSRPAFGVTEKDKLEVLSDISKCKTDTELAAAIAARTVSIALGLNKNDTLSLPLVATSALLSGSGIEHPAENGFAFLRPYGVPYIPGSGIKGALRAAAEHRALFDPESGWSMADIWWLFGWESQADYWKANADNERSDAFRRWLHSENNNLESAIALLEMLGVCEPRDALQSLSFEPEKLAFRGLLSFWDMPLPNAASAVDIMTPHYSGYYTGKKPPNETDDPVPIGFLVVAPSAKARLTLQWRSVGPKLEELEAVKQLWSCWKDKMQALIRDVILWDGLGAKTAVGYGRFKIDEQQIEDDQNSIRDAEEAIARQKQQLQVEAHRSSMGKEQYALFELEEAFLQQAPGIIEKLNALIRIAIAQWKAADKEQLHSLAEEIYRANPVTGKRPRKKRIELLEELKNQ